MMFSVIVLKVALFTCSFHFVIGDDSYVYDPSQIKVSYGDEMIKELVIVKETVSKLPCTLFGNRVSGPEHSLVNCSWYAKNACCKRIEVTAVFSSMPTMKSSTVKCQNLLSYLMCYFCSPYQRSWFQNTIISVCSDFCRSLFENCREAKVEGVSVGKLFPDGKAFCESQSFHVVDGRHNCFDFDPTVFSAAPSLIGHCFACRFLLCLVFVLLNM